MKTINYSTFKNNLKDYLKEVNVTAEPLTVINQNSNEDIVVISKDYWESLQETILVMENDYLSKKIIDGLAQVEEQQRTRQQELLKRKEETL